MKLTFLLLGIDFVKQKTKTGDNLITNKIWRETYSFVFSVV